MNFIPNKKHLFSPLCFNNQIEHLLLGCSTLGQKWIKYKSSLSDDIYINPLVLPSSKLILSLQNLKHNQILVQDQHIIGYYKNNSINTNDFKKLEYKDFLKIIHNFSDLLNYNAEEIKKDFSTLKDLNKITPDSLLSKNQVYIHPTARVDQAILNTEDGPIIIGEKAHIMDGAILKGPVAVMDHSIVKMGSQIYPGTTIGSHCTVAGEIKNCIIHEYSNKGHEGYLGDSILGRWNNFGGGTTVSNVSNTFGQIKTYDWETNQPITLPTIKRGVITGDFVRTGIQTNIFSGTKIGSFSSIVNIHPISGNISPLTWLTNDKNELYQIDRARTHAQRQMKLKNRSWNHYWEEQLLLQFEDHNNRIK